MAEPKRASRRHPPASTPSTTASPDPETALDRKHRADAERVLRLPQVEARTGLGGSTIYEMIGRDEFPASFPIGARAVGWLDSEITDWIVSRAAARRGKSGDDEQSAPTRAQQSRPAKAKPVETA